VITDKEELLVKCMDAERYNDARNWREHAARHLLQIPEDDPASKAIACALISISRAISEQI